MEVCEVFEKFNLKDLPDEWIGDYSVEIELPTEYEMYLIENNISIASLLREARIGVFHWLIENRLNLTDSVQSPKSDNCNDSRPNNFRQKPAVNENKTWQFFIQNGLQYKALLSLLNIFITQGKTNLQNVESRQLCYKAIRLYFILLAIPGSKVFKIFNYTLYSNVTKSLKAICEDITEKSGGFRFGQCNKSNKDCDDYGLDDVLKDYIFFINEFRFSDQNDSLVLTIETLLDIARLEKKSSTLISTVSGQESVLSLCYSALKDLCKAPHGKVDNTVTLIMGKLMKNFLLENNHSRKSKEFNIVKENSIKFISFILDQVGEFSYMGINSLVQNICFNMIPDRAEERLKYVQIVYEIISEFPDELLLKFEIWIMKLCFSDEVKNKLTSLELISKLLISCQRQRSSVKFLLGTIFAAYYSSWSTVQTKALTILAHLLVSKSTYVQQEMETIFIRSDSFVNVHRKSVIDFYDFIMKRHTNLDTTVNPLPEAQDVINYLNLLLKHKAISVSKAACQVLTNIFLLNEKLMTNNQQTLEQMKIGCRYLAVSDRIQFMQSMTDLLLFYPGNKQLQEHWIQSVLPLLNDPESRSQEKALQNAQNVLLNNIVPLNKMRLPQHKLPWDLLLLTTELNKNSLWSVACDKWSKNNSIRPSLFTDIFTHVGTENNISAWCLLTYLCMFVEIKNSKVIDDVLNYFYNYVLVKNAKLMGSDYVIEVLFMNCKKLLKKDQNGLIERLETALNQFDIPAIWIARFMDICHLLKLNFGSTEKKGREDVIEWTKALIQTAEEKLKAQIGPEVHQPVQKAKYLQKLIFTLAEAISILPGEISDETISMIEKMLLDKRDRIRTVESHKKGSISSIVLGVAVVFLGRLSLLQETIAIQYVPLFVTLLKESKYDCVKINSMLSLVDLCKKFTSIVEKHIPDICLCLRDSSHIIRLKTLQLLIGLICEDYLKVRCPLFFYLLLMLLDKDETIQEEIKQFIMQSLLIKHKNIMYQHFIEGLFYYNACYEHPMLSNYVLHAEEAKVFSLNGDRRRTERRQIYTFMLKNMSDEERFNLKTKLCIDVVDKFISGVIPLGSNTNELMRDVLHLLCSKDMQNHSQQPEQDEDNENREVINDVAVEGFLKVVKNETFFQVVKINTKEVVLPILLHLRAKLKKIKSPLMPDLINCLRSLRKNYKDQMNEILSSDKELAEEINFGDQNHPQNDVEEADTDRNSDLAKALLDIDKRELRVSLNRICVAYKKTLPKENDSCTVLPDSSKDDSNDKDKTNIMETDSTADSIVSLFLASEKALLNVNNSSIFASSADKDEPVMSTTKTVECKQQSLHNLNLSGPDSSYLEPQTRVRCSKNNSKMKCRTIQNDSTIQQETLHNINNSSAENNDPVVSTTKMVEYKQRSSDNFNLSNPSTSYSKPQAKVWSSKNSSRMKYKAIQEDPTTQQEAIDSVNNLLVFDKNHETVSSTSKSVECDQQSSHYLSVSGPSTSSGSSVDSNTDNQKRFRKKMNEILSSDKELAEEINFGDQNHPQNDVEEADTDRKSDLAKALLDIDKRELRVSLNQICVAYKKTLPKENDSCTVLPDSSKDDSNAKDKTNIMETDSTEDSIVSLFLASEKALLNVNNSSIFASSANKDEPVMSTTKTVECKQQSLHNLNLSGPGSSYLKPQTRVRCSKNNSKMKCRTIQNDSTIQQETLHNINNSSAENNDPVVSTTKMVEYKQRSSDNFNLSNPSTSYSKPQAKVWSSKNSSRMKCKAIQEDPTTQQEAIDSVNNSLVFDKNHETVSSTSKSVECDQQSSHYLSVSGPSTSSGSSVDSNTENQKRFRKKVRKR